MKKLTSLAMALLMLLLCAVPAFAVENAFPNVDINVDVAVPAPSAKGLPLTVNRQGNTVKCYSESGNLVVSIVPHGKKEIMPSGYSEIN